MQPNKRMHLTAASELAVPSGRWPEAAGDARRWAVRIAFRRSPALVCLDADGFREGRISVLLLQQRPFPIHVHVRKGDGEAVFDVDDEVVLRESYGLKIKELSRAQELAEENRAIIIEKWHEHIG